MSEGDTEAVGTAGSELAEVGVESIGTFVQLNLRDANAWMRDVRLMVSALEMICEVHREADALCNGCDRPWPCATIRAVASTWRGHPDYDGGAWRTETDYPQDKPLSDAEKAYLIEHGGVDPKVLSPERLARVDRQLEENLEQVKYVQPFNDPCGLREVLDALPDMSHSELMALLNEPLDGLNDASPIGWLAEGGSAWVVMETLLGVPLQEVAERASQIWPLSAVPDWLVGSNDYLDGARPIDVIRLRGQEEVLAALDAEEQLSR